MLGSHDLLISSAGDIRYDEAMGYPMVQQWRVRSNLYRVKLSTITLSAGEDRLQQPGDWHYSAHVPGSQGPGVCPGLALGMLRE